MYSDSQILDSKQPAAKPRAGPACAHLIRIPGDCSDARSFFKNRNGQDTIDKSLVPHHCSEQFGVLDLEAIVEFADARSICLPFSVGHLFTWNPFVPEPRLLPVFFLGIQEFAEGICRNYHTICITCQDRRMARTARGHCGYGAGGFQGGNSGEEPSNWQKPNEIGFVGRQE